MATPSRVAGVSPRVSRLDAEQLGGLDQRVEERGHTGSSLGAAPVVILATDSDAAQRPLPMWVCSLDVGPAPLARLLVDRTLFLIGRCENAA
jgi:hypothetical protein